jgi:hypothetical protein
MARLSAIAASSRMTSSKTLAWGLKGVGVFMRQFYHLVRGEGIA